MGKASIIDDSIDYIQSLQKQIKETEADISDLQSGTLEYSRSGTKELISSSSIESELLDNYDPKPAKCDDQKGFKILQVSSYRCFII